MSIRTQAAADFARVLLHAGESCTLTTAAGTSTVYLVQNDYYEAIEGNGFASVDSDMLVMYGSKSDLAEARAGDAVTWNGETYELTQDPQETQHFAKLTLCKRPHKGTS